MSRRGPSGKVGFFGVAAGGSAAVGSGVLLEFRDRSNPAIEAGPGQQPDFDLKQESAATHQLYGTEPGKESFANNCLLARRLAERGVRYIQLFHWGGGSHGASASEAINKGFSDRCKEVDAPMTALLKDLKQRGLGASW